MRSVKLCSRSGIKPSSKTTLYDTMDCFENAVASPRSQCTNQVKSVIAVQKSGCGNCRFKRRRLRSHVREPRFWIAKKTHVRCSDLEGGGPLRKGPSRVLDCLKLVIDICYGEYSMNLVAHNLSGS